MSSKEKASKTKIKGRSITCKSCSYQFKFDTDRKRNRWRNNKQMCPECGTWFCNLIETERKLFTHQELFYETGKDKHIESMYSCLVSYGGSLAKTLLSKSLKGDDHLNYHTHSAATLVIEQFYNKKCSNCGGKMYAEKESKLCNCEKSKFVDYKIRSSFGSYLVSKLKESLYGKENLTAGSIKKRSSEGEVSVLTPVSIDRPDKVFEGQENEEVSLQIEQEVSEIDMVEINKHKEDILNGVLAIVFEEDKKLSSGEKLLSLFQIHRSLTGKRKDIDNVYSACGRNLKYRTDFIMNNLYRFLMNVNYEY